MAKMKRCAKFQDRLLPKVCLTALIVCLNVILLMKRLPPILTQEVRCSKLGELTHEGRTLWVIQSKQNFVWENGQVLAALAGLNFQVQI